MLDEAQARPEMFRHLDAVRSMQQDVLTAFYRSLTLRLSPQRRVTRAIRQRGLRRAIEHLRSVDTALVTVAELCAAAHVTQRTLEYAFRETFGLSPSGFVQSRRYHAARRDLLAADGKTARVQAIAQCNGFYQMGLFALRYRERFGESPSETLMKPPPDGRCGLLRWEDSGLK